MAKHVLLLLKTCIQSGSISIQNIYSVHKNIWGVVGKIEQSDKLDGFKCNILAWRFN